MAWSEFPGYIQGGSTQTEPSSLPEVKRQSVPGKPTSIYGIKYKRRESCTGKAPNVCISQHMCVKKPLKASERP